MANEKNLIPNSERSPNELREMAKKGGKASGIARRRKADLRKAMQAVLLSSFEDKEGNKKSGEEILVNKIFMNAADRDSRNWGKAVDTILQLTGANKSKEEVDKLKAEIAAMKAKQKQIEQEEKQQNEMIRISLDWGLSENGESKTVDT